MKTPKICLLETSGSMLGFRFLRKSRAITTALLLIAASSPLAASNHYILAGATGTANGSSWTNAYPSFLAATTAGFVRGDTYYVGGGTYVENIGISVALNGTIPITIIKASVATNGSDPGWNPIFASNVATINGSVDLDKGFVTLNGVTGSGTSGYGIVINNPGISNVLTLEDASSFSVSHCEIRGAGFAASTLAFVGISYNCIAGAQKNTYIGNCWIHETTTNGVQILNTVGTSYSDYGFLFENNVVSETGGCLDPNNHGQGMQLGLSSELGFCIIRNNTYRNIVGSGMIVFLGSTGANHHDIDIYNNIFYITDLTTYGVLSPGVIWAEAQRNGATGVALNNLTVNNNTFYGLGSVSASSVSATIILEAPTANNVLEDNVWENCRLAGSHEGFATEGFNGYFGNNLNVPTGTPKQVGGSASTFVNAAAFDFRLTAGGYAIGRGTNFPNLPTTTDFVGLPRGGTWDLGAYQYQTGTTVAPSGAQVAITVSP